MISVRSVVLLTAAGALALSAGFAVRHLSKDYANPTGLLSDATDVKALFSASMPDLKGNQISLAKWQGKVLVVNFWATWCAPCREEIPDFIQLQGEYGSKGVQFVGIAADQADKVARFSEEFKITYPILIGSLGALDLAKKLGDSSSSLPFTVVLDRSGNVVHRQLGILKPDKLRALLGGIR